MFTYSLLGMEVFAFKAKFDSTGNVDMNNGTPPSANFNGFVNSFTTIFIILTNDGWSNIFFNYYRAAGGAIATIFFVSLIGIG